MESYGEMTHKWRKGSLDKPSLSSEIHMGSVGKSQFCLNKRMREKGMVTDLNT